MSTPDDFALFPLFEARADGTCACGKAGCENAGKHPEYPFASLTRGQKVRGVEGRNYGIATGERSGVFVVDFDSVEAFEALADKFPETYAVATSRGVHLYYEWPGFPVKNSAGQLAPHVDIRGDGGFVVAAGSKHRSGAMYEVIADGPIAKAPPWLLIWSGLRGEVRKTNANANAPIPVEGDELVRRLALYREDCAVMPPAISGQGGSEALWAVALRGVRTYELPLEDCASIIGEVYNPRCSPEWSEAEIWHKLEDARDKSDMPCGIPPEGWKLEPPAMAHGSVTEPVPVPAGKLDKISFAELCSILHRNPEWDGVLRWDVLKRRHVAVKPPIPMRMEQGCLSNGDLGAVRLWLAAGEVQGYNVSEDAVKQALITVAERRPYNPFAAYLDGLPEVGGSDELGRVHETVLRSPAGPMVSSIFRKHLVAAVRRARAAGTGRAIDHQIIFVLYGKQDAGKTRLIKTLAGPEFYGSLTGDLANKDTILKLHGKILVELEEMTTANRADRNALKAFLSAAEDEHRAPYERSAELVQRSYVLFGTTNDPQLDDPTGRRRFVIVPVADELDHAYAEAHRDVYWAEANALAAREDFDTHLTRAEKDFVHQVSEVAEVDDPLADQLREALAGLHFVKMWEAWDLVTKGNHEPSMKRQEMVQYAENLRRIGCERFTAASGLRGWKVPREISDLARSKEATRLKDADAEKVRTQLARAHLKIA